jgi:hypothetical protein
MSCLHCGSKRCTGERCPECTAWQSTHGHCIDGSHMSVKWARHEQEEREAERNRPSYHGRALVELTRGQAFAICMTLVGLFFLWLNLTHR